MQLQINLRTLIASNESSLAKHETRSEPSDCLGPYLIRSCRGPMTEERNQEDQENYNRSFHKVRGVELNFQSSLSDDEPS